MEIFVVMLVATVVGLFMSIGISQNADWFLKVDLTSLSVLFVAIVAIAAVLVGVAVRDSSVWWLLPPTVLGVVAILNLRK